MAHAPDPDDTPSPSGVELLAYLRAQGYEVLSELGRGGMGLVLKARQVALDRVCALKVIRANRLSSPRVHARFVREVKAAARLSHPNLVTVFHTNLEGPIKFLAMEYVPGETLVKLVQQNGPMDVSLAVELMRQAAEGLVHSHEQGMVHRDIKPSNLMITPWPAQPGKRVTLKILDMGLARQTDADDETGLTQAGEILGTPDYIAPEQADDPRLADVRSDMYSLGASFFVILTGKLPFEGATLTAKIRKHAMEIPPTVRSIRPEVPVALSNVIARLMEKKPEHRFQTPAELAAVCLDILAGRPTDSGAYRRQPDPGSGRYPTNPVTPSLNVGSSVQARVASFVGHAREVRCLRLTEDGGALITGGADETIRVWSVRTKRQVRQMEVKGGEVAALALSPDGRFVASAAQRIFEDPNQIDLHDAQTGKFRGRLRGMKTPIRTLDYSPDGLRVAAGSEDGTVILWSLDGVTPPRKLVGHQAPIEGIEFLANGERLLSACRDGHLALWDAAGAPRGTLTSQVTRLRCLAMSGSRVAIGGDQLKVRFSDNTFLTLHGHDGPIRAVAFAPNRRYLVSGGEDGTVRVWSLDLSEEVESLPPVKGPVQSLRCSPADGSIFVATCDGTVVQRSLATVELV